MARRTAVRSLTRFVDGLSIAVERGTPLADAKLVFEGRPQDMVVSAFHDQTRGFERDFVARRPSFWKSELFLRRGDKLLKIEKPDDVESLFYHGALLRRLIGGEA